MKKIKFLTLIGFLILSFCAAAQIKIYDDNRVKIFGDRPSDDLYKDLSMQVYGKYGSSLANARIGFGNYDLSDNFLYHKRVFVGELGTNWDSDRLELCGSSGLYFTRGKGYDFGEIIGKLNLEYEIVNGVITDVSSFKFNTDVYAKGVIINSDKRFKENIKPLRQAMYKLQKIRGVTYNLKPTTKSQKGSTGFNAPNNEKEAADIALLAETEQKMKNLYRSRIGFVAQELKEIFPELVKENPEGYLFVDYVGLVPVLVESIKQQQTQIATLKSLLLSQKTIIH